MKYFIKKFSNGEFKEQTKEFVLNTNKYCSDKSSLFFTLNGEEQVCFDSSIWSSIVINQIQAGLVEKMSYDNGIIRMVVRDGNTVTNCSYDFRWEQFNGNNRSAVEDLKTMVCKVVTIYNENPNKAQISESRCLRVIFDILDAVRFPQYEDKAELMRVFEVYNKDKAAILLTLLNNVVFFDKDGNAIEQSAFARKRSLKKIKQEVLQQMEQTMNFFATTNGADALYQQYQMSTFIPKLQVVYKYVDADGNDIAPGVVAKKNSMFAFTKEVIKQRLREKRAKKEMPVEEKVSKGL